MYVPPLRNLFGRGGLLTWDSPLASLVFRLFNSCATLSPARDVPPLLLPCPLQPSIRKAPMFFPLTMWTGAAADVGAVPTVMVADIGGTSSRFILFEAVSEELVMGQK